MPQSRKRKSGKGGISSRQVYASSRRSKQKKTTQYIIIASLVIGVLAIAAAAFLLTRGNHEVTTDSGLKYIDLVEGTGETPKPGQTVSVHYTVWLENGTKVQSSVDSGQPLRSCFKSYGSNEIQALTGKKQPNY